MTPEEAIYFLKGIQNENADYSMEEAISVLKEIQQYRLIKDATIGEIAEALKEYAEIGTVKECREAREKQIPKECIIDSCPDHTHYKCPSCGEILMSVYPRVCGNGCITPYCKKCGQALRMENKDD